MLKPKRKRRYENGSINRVRIIKDPKRRPQGPYNLAGDWYSFKNDMTDASDVFGVANMVEARDRLWDYLRNHAERIHKHMDGSTTIYARVPIKKHLDNCCTRKEHRA